MIASVPLLIGGSLAAAAILDQIYGVRVRKALDPNDPKDFDLIVATLEGQLSDLAKPAQKKALQAALQALDVDWKSTSPESRRKIFIVANTALRTKGMPIPKMVDTVAVAAGKTAVAAGQSAAKEQGISIEASFDEASDSAQKATRHNLGLYVTNNMGQIDDAAAAKARQIVEAGIKNGATNGKIAKQLEAELEAYALGRSRAYYTMLAGVHLNRARTRGLLSSFSQAGARFYEFIAVRDEVTTPQCRYLHGKTFPIADAIARMDAVADGEDPKTTTPWIQFGKDDDGAAVLYTRNSDGTKNALAQVHATGYGEIDGEGSFTPKVDSRGLVKLGVTIPPCHANAVFGDSLITTARGRVRCADVRVGDLVLTHRGRWRAVTATRAKVVQRRPVLALFTASGRALGVTYEHPVLTARGWIHARDVRAGDVLFDNAEQVPRSASGGVGDTHHAPPFPHQPGVAPFVVLSACGIPMVFPVDLDDQTLRNEGNVRHEAADVVLCDGPEGSKEIEENLLVRGHFSAQVLGTPGSDLAGGGIDTGWIAGSHLVAALDETGVRFSAQTESPVRGPAWSALAERGAVVRDLHLVESRTDGDAVALAPTRDRARRDAVFALDLTDRSAFLNVFGGDDRSEEVTVDEGAGAWVWHTATVNYIAAGRYDGVLMDLSVDADESFVANGLIVHNCRSTLAIHEGPAVMIQVPGQVASPPEMDDPFAPGEGDLSFEDDEEAGAFDPAQTTLPGAKFTPPKPTSPTHPAAPKISPTVTPYVDAPKVKPVDDAPVLVQVADPADPGFKIPPKPAGFDVPSKPTKPTTPAKPAGGTDGDELVPVGTPAPKDPGFAIPPKPTGTPRTFEEQQTPEALKTRDKGYMPTNPGMVDAAKVQAFEDIPRTSAHIDGSGDSDGTLLNGLDSRAVLARQDEAIAHLKKTPGAFEAMQAYTGNSSAHIRRAELKAAKGEPAHPDLIRMSALLNETMRTAPALQVTCYRAVQGMPRAAIDYIIGSDVVRFGRQDTGATTSTSTNPDKSYRFSDSMREDAEGVDTYKVLYVVRNKTGVYVGKESATDDEQEIILRKDATYRKISVGRPPGTERILIVELEEID